jgi:hypothetical protein
MPLSPAGGPGHVGDGLEALPEVEVPPVGRGHHHVGGVFHHHAVIGGALLGQQGLAGGQVAAGDGSQPVGPVQHVLHAEGLAAAGVQGASGGVDKAAHAVIGGGLADLVLALASQAQQVQPADALGICAAGQEHLGPAAKARLQVRRDRTDHDAQVGLG